MRDPLPRRGAGEEAAAQPSQEGDVDLVASPVLAPSSPCVDTADGTHLSPDDLDGDLRPRRA
jgi:hypothetical protein